MAPGINHSIEKAAAYLKSGDIRSARRLLVAVLRENKEDELAWYYLNHVVEEPEKKIYALRQVLRINPDNRRAIAKIEALEEDYVAEISSHPVKPAFKSEMDEQLSEAAGCIRDRDFSRARGILQSI